MKAQCYVSIYYQAMVPDRTGREYTIKYATHINKGKTWRKTTDAKSATTLENLETPLPTPLPEVKAE